MSEHVCSFCGKDHTQVKHMVQGMGGAYICDGCVREARGITEPEPEGETVLQRTLITLIIKGIGVTTHQAAADARSWADILSRMGVLLIAAQKGMPHEQIRALAKEISDLEYDLTLDCKATGDILELWPTEDDEDDDEG